MSQTLELKGQCLCGRIRVVARRASNSVGACHCKTCRRWGGGPFMEVHCGQDVSLDGEEYLSLFDSSDWAERGFCRVCGTHLFYRIKESGEHMIPVGVFDDGSDLAFETQVFIDEKPGFYRFADETRNLTGAELFALFRAPD